MQGQSPPNFQSASLVIAQILWWSVTFEDSYVWVVQFRLVRATIEKNSRKRHSFQPDSTSEFRLSASALTTYGRS